MSMSWPDATMLWHFSSRPDVLPSRSARAKGCGVSRVVPPLPQLMVHELCVTGESRVGRQQRRRVDEAGRRLSFAAPFCRRCYRQAASGRRKPARLIGGRAVTKRRCGSMRRANEPIDIAPRKHGAWRVHFPARVRARGGVTRSIPGASTDCGEAGGRRACWLPGMSGPITDVAFDAGLGDISIS